MKPVGSPGGFVSAPSGVVADRFASFPSREEIQRAPELQPEALPQPFSHEEIARQMEPLLTAIQAQHAPAPIPQPPSVGPLGSFVSALAGNLGSFLTRNPLYAEQVQQNITEQTRHRQAIEQENYAQQLAFDAGKQRQLVGAAAQEVEAQLGEAIKNKDADRAAALSRNLARLQTQLAAMYRIPQETIMRVIQTEAQGEQARKTEETKETGREALQGIKGGQALEQIGARGEQARETKAAPTAQQNVLSMKDYLAARAAVARNPRIPDSPPFGLDAFMQQRGLKPRAPASKSEEAEMTDAGAAVNGATPEVRNLGWRNLKVAVARRLGVRVNQEPTAADAQRIMAEIANRYGLTPGGP